MTTDTPVQLKYAYDVWNADVLQWWLENPCWQYFCGGVYFKHELPLKRVTKFFIAWKL